jgi:hypothetical protein
MPRRLLFVFTLVSVFLVLAGILHAQELPDAFNAALRDVSTREGRTLSVTQLVDYSYSEALDNFYADCGIGEPLRTRFYTITILTESLNRYIYHVTTDGSRVQLCHAEPVQPTATPTIDLTRYTATPTLIPTATETPRTGAVRCEGFMYSRLRVGEQGRVMPGDPNRLREYPDVMSAQLRLIPAGAAFDVLEGPRCDMGSEAWWRVRYLNTEGWTLEGYGLNYYVEPVIVSVALFPTNTVIPTLTATGRMHPTSCPGSPVPRLTEFGWGRVTPGEPNNMRKGASASHYIVGIIPAGETFKVIASLECDETGRTWWLVEYQGVRGWTLEGEGDTYYVEPIIVPPTLAPGN